MKKHLNGFRPMSREEQEQMSGGYTFSWFTYDDYGYASGSSGATTKSTSSTTPTTATTSTNQTKNHNTIVSEPVKSPHSSSSVDKTTKTVGSGGTINTGSTIKTSTVDFSINTGSNSQSADLSSAKTQVKTQSASQIAPQSEASNAKPIVTTISQTKEKNEIPVLSKENSIASHTTTDISQQNNALQQTLTQAPDLSVLQTVNSQTGFGGLETSSKASESGIMKPEYTQDPAQGEEFQQNRIPDPDHGQLQYMNDESGLNITPNQEDQYPFVFIKEEGRSDGQGAIKNEIADRPTRNQEIAPDHMGLWMDQRFLSQNEGGFCLAASLLNLYQSKDVEISQRQVVEIMKEAMVTRSWNDNPVVSLNGFVQEPDTFLAIAALHLGQQALSTGDRKYQNATISFAGQTAGLTQGNERLSLSVAQGYIDSFRDHLGYGNSDVAGLVVELKSGNRTHFVSVQGWELSALTDPHGGRNRSDWSIASIRMVT